MACFRCNTIEILIFLLKCCQRKVDLNTSKNSLLSVTIRQKFSSLSPTIVYENFILTQKFPERCCFLTFSFEGKSRKYDISVKRKHTKTNENMVSSVLFTIFHKTKILFFMQCCNYPKLTQFRQTKHILKCNIFVFVKKKRFE